MEGFSSAHLITLGFRIADVIAVVHCGIRAIDGSAPLVSLKSMSAKCASYQRLSKRKQVAQKPVEGHEN